MTAVASAIRACVREREEREREREDEGGKRFVKNFVELDSVY